MNDTSSVLQQINTVLKNQMGWDQEQDQDDYTIIPQRALPSPTGWGFRTCALRRLEYQDFEEMVIRNPMETVYVYMHKKSIESCVTCGSYMHGFTMMEPGGHVSVAYSIGQNLGFASELVVMLDNVTW